MDVDVHYLLTSSLLLFLPGYAATILFGLNRHRFLFSFSLSYASFVLLLKATNLMGMSAIVFRDLYLVLVVLLVLLAILKILWIFRSEGAIRPLSPDPHLVSDTVVPFAIAITTSVYMALAGPYLEVPADVFRHMEFIRGTEWQILNSEATGDLLSSSYLGQNGKYWYFYYAFVNHWLGLELTESITEASLFNTAVFLVGVYFFTHTVFRLDETRIKWRTSIAILTVTFTFLHFGINIFSYIRYYAMAPAMLNFVLYFTIMTVVIEFFRKDAWKVRDLLAAAIVFTASVYIHRQESLFAVVMMFLMATCLFVRLHASRIHSWWSGQNKQLLCPFSKALQIKVNLLFSAAALVVTMGFLYSHLNLDRYHVVQPKLIPLETILPFIKHLYILNPTYQFYYVVTLWGLFVIVLFIINWRRLWENTYVVAGMLSPLLTVFNPIFVDFFLRHGTSHMIWRLLFLVPIHFVAAWQAVEVIHLFRNRKRWSWVYSTITITGLVVLLFPIHTTYIDSPYSRLLTLQAVPKEQGVDHWRDLLEYLDTLEDRHRIITDPVTGYMISAMTGHYSTRFKFTRLRGYVEINYDDYSGHPFDFYQGALLVINRRNGASSETGSIARHWPTHILKVSNYYQSEKLEPYVKSHPERFEWLWEQDKIQVYRIK